MKLKEWYEKLYEKIFSIRFFRFFLKIPGVEKLLQYEILSYLVFGLLTTVVSMVSYAGANKLAAAFFAPENVAYQDWVLFSIGQVSFKWIQIAQAISWVFAVVFAFLTNKLFVFESRSFAPRVALPEFGAFVAARLFSFFVFEELAFGLLEALFSRMGLGASDWIAKIAVAVFVIVFNYVASKLLIFRKKKDAKATEEKQV